MTGLQGDRGGRRHACPGFRHPPPCSAWRCACPEPRPRVAVRRGSSRDPPGWRTTARAERCVGPKARRNPHEIFCFAHCHLTITPLYIAADNLAGPFDRQRIRRQPMQLQRPEPTPIRAALAAVFLRGGGVDESRDASPPGAGSGAPAGQANRRLTSTEGPRLYNEASGPAAQRPSGPAAQRPSGPAA